MALTLWELNDLKSGRHENIWVGEFPYDVARFLNLKNHNVYLSRISLKHIFEDHPDVKLTNILILPMAIKQGLLVRETKKPNMIMVSYLDTIERRRWIAAVKIAEGGNDNWVSSFYRSRQRQTKSICSRGTVIKGHD